MLFKGHMRNNSTYLRKLYNMDIECIFGAVGSKAMPASNGALYKLWLIITNVAILNTTTLSSSVILGICLFVC